MTFYSASGLRDIALWLDELIEGRKQTTQQAIADCAGSSGSTIGSLRMHRHNQPDLFVSRKPDPDLILSLGRCIPDPQTEQPFADEWRLLWVAIGKEPLRTPPPPTPPSSHPYPAAQRELKRLIKKLGGLEKAATLWHLSPDRLLELLHGTGDRVIPDTREAHQIVRVSYEDKLINRISDLYLDPSPEPKSAAPKSVDSANPPSPSPDAR